MVTLFSYNVSPYAAKVRAILRHKGIAFEERIVDPLDRRELKRLSGQVAVPVLQDGQQVIADSTAIARFLDEKYPQKSILPKDPVLRARALLLEEWADEGLPRVVQPVRWLMPGNVEKSCALMRSAYPQHGQPRGQSPLGAPRLASLGSPMGALQDAKWKVIQEVLLWGMRRQYAPRPPMTLKPSRILNRLAECMDYLDGALAETGWLAGPEPSVADFAVFGFLNFLQVLDGWETVKARRRVAKLVKTLGDATEKPTEKVEAYDAEDAAQMDARQHREEKKRLPLI